MTYRQRKVLTASAMLEDDYFSREDLLRSPPKDTCPVSLPSQRTSFIVVCLCLLTLTPLLLYHLLTEHNPGFGLDDDNVRLLVNVKDIDDYNNAGKLTHSLNDIDHKINELNRIKLSVLKELKELEERRWKIREDIQIHESNLAQVKTEVADTINELTTLSGQIQQAKLELREIQDNDRPHLTWPTQLKPKPLAHIQPMTCGLECNICTMASCFDFSRCSITSPLRIFIYPSKSAPQQNIIQAVAERAGQITSDPSFACIFVHILEPNFNVHELEHWKEDGHNHVLISVQDRPILNPANTRAILVTHHIATARTPYDVLLPPVDPSPVLIETLPLLLPAYRKYLLSFWASANQISTYDDKMMQILKAYQMAKSRDSFFFEFECSNIDSKWDGTIKLCGDLDERSALLKNSTFSLVPLNNETAAIRRLWECLIHGAIPVIVYGDDSLLDILPLKEVLDWNLVSYSLPISRLPELHVLLRSISPNELLEMKRTGRLFVQHYFNGLEGSLSTAFAYVRHRIGIPAPIATQNTGVPLFGDKWSAANVDEPSTPQDNDEFLGPLESPYPSPEFETNFTLISRDKYTLWNHLFHPVFLRYPYLPWRNVMPTEARFSPGTTSGFRSIAGGEGGSGKPFSESLGGNVPREQFTMVILNYEREQVLISSIERVHRLPYLHKVVVVWNGPNSPSENAIWPKLNVPVVFVKPEKNSLNNRFLPFSHIETEAVLSIDDDVHLTQAEIVFAFRVWRENRDRIVGFPGRFHAWEKAENSWRYNSNHSCELSMVLTGASFIHKYYHYIYSQWMPKQIHSLVDQVMNCEDLAMNFLIAHLTRKPPIKVTSKWTFRCAGCPDTLSNNESHFTERHMCMQKLTQLYGYNPLLYTQFRADSVLFKTRLPHHHQKCFKFI